MNDYSPALIALGTGLVISLFIGAYFLIRRFREDPPHDPYEIKPPDEKP